MTRASRLSDVTLSPAAVRRLYPQTREVRRTVLGRIIIRRVRSAADLRDLPDMLVWEARLSLMDKTKHVWIIRDESSIGGIALLITRR